MQTKKKGWRNVLLIIIPWCLTSAIFQFIGLYLSGGTYKSMESGAAEHALILSFADLLGTCCIVWIFMRYVDKQNFIEIGLQTNNKLNECILGIGIGALVMGGGYFLLVAIREIYFVEIVFDTRGIIQAIFLFINVALVEEILVRGYVLRNLMNSFNRYLALVLSSVLFSFMHVANPHIDYFSFIDLFLAGLVLGGTYIYTKNLWFPIGLHFGWNLFQTYFGFNVSGQDFYSLVEFKIFENNKLNGGPFGFEGSIFSVIAEIILIIGIERHYRKKRHQALEISRKKADGDEETFLEAPLVRPL